MEWMGVGVGLQTGKRIGVGGRRSVAWPDLMIEGGRRADELDMVEGEMVNEGVHERATGLHHITTLLPVDAQIHLTASVKSEDIIVNSLYSETLPHFTVDFLTAASDIFMRKTGMSTMDTVCCASSYKYACNVALIPLLIAILRNPSSRSTSCGSEVCNQAFQILSHDTGIKSMP